MVGATYLLEDVVEEGVVRVVVHGGRRKDSGEGLEGAYASVRPGSSRAAGEER